VTGCVEEDRNRPILARSVPLEKHPVEDKHSQSRRDCPRGFKIAVAGQYGPISETPHGYDERVDVKSVCRIARSILSSSPSGAVAEAH
jgi:hypothetical protein